MGLRATYTTGSSYAFYGSTYCCSVTVWYPRGLLSPIVEPIPPYFTTSTHRSYSDLTDQSVTALGLTKYNTVLLLKITVAERILQSTERIAVHVCFVVARTLCYLSYNTCTQPTVEHIQLTFSRRSNLTSVWTTGVFRRRCLQKCLPIILFNIVLDANLRWHSVWFAKCVYIRELITTTAGSSHIRMPHRR